MKMRAINADAEDRTPSLRLAHDAFDRGNGRAGWARIAAYTLAFAAGGLAVFAVQRALPHDSRDQPVAASSGPMVQTIPLANDEAHRPVDRSAEKMPDDEHLGEADSTKQKPADAPATAANSPAHRQPDAAPHEAFVVVGVTEPAPGKYAKLPLATSQAVAFIDVKPGDRVQKGFQVFSHWESPDRLQAVQAETEKSKKLLEVAKARAASAERTLARFDRLKTQATEQEREDAQTAAEVRKQELAAAELAVTEAERRFKAMKFEFEQAFVTSPIDGIVTAVDVVLGERRQVGNAFRGVTVLDPRVLYCRCMLTAEQAAMISAGEYASENKAETHTADGHPEATKPIRATVESQHRKYEATVASIGAIADGATGLIPVLVEVKNPDESLRVGVRADVRFEDR